MEKKESTMTANSEKSSGFDKYAVPAEVLDFNIDYLTAAHIKEVEKCNGYAKGDAAKHFDHVATNIEAAYLRLGYPDPKKVAEMINKHAKARGLPKDCKILDLGCGTGLIGQYLKEFGFTNVTGIDVSPVMLSHAKEKQAYAELVEYDLLDLDNFPGKLRNACDVVCCSGLVNNNHMDYKLFEMMILALK